MKIALNLLDKRLMLVAAVLALAACGGTNPATQPGDDVAADVGVDDSVTASDAAADVGKDTQDTASKTDVAEVSDDVPPDVAPQCTTNSECNDNDPCTDNICAKGVCSNPQNAGPCDDGDPCTQNDYCKKGICAGNGTCTDTVDDTSDVTATDAGGDASGDTAGDTGSATNCSKGEWDSTTNIAFVTALGTCGTGACKPAGAPITNTLDKACMATCIAQTYPMASQCADCFGDLSVCVSTSCVSECSNFISATVTDPACISCSAQKCGKALSACSGFSAPDCAADADCDDKSACTTDTCTNMFCSNTAIVCDDGNACTTDSCDKTKGCVTVALPASVTCDDGNACTVGDNCGTGTCTGSAKVCDDGNACTDDGCDLSGACTTTNNAVSCDDGVTCTTADACAGGACSGTANNGGCDDGNACTVDACDSKKGCLHTAAGAIACDDGNFCTVADACDVTTCTGAAGTPCSDNNVCTNDSCDPAAGNSAILACSHSDISGSKCDDGNACTADSCDPTAGCVNTKLSATSCDDGNANTIGDTCTAGVCAGTVPQCLNNGQCDDGKACTGDVCDPTTHACTHTVTAGNCLVDGTCYSDGQGNPSNACLACSATASSNSWSVANETFSCGTAGTCASGTCVDPWPPTAPLANGKVCALPTCDASTKPAFYTGGNWTVTTKTVSTTCNAIIQLVEPRANVGYTKTGKPHPMNFIGGCDYAPGGTATQIGSIVSNVEASCSVSVDANYGVTSVETSIITYGAGKGTGTATATLYDLPPVAGEPNNSCEIVVQVTVQHVPDCTTDGDCSDGISCTTDVCSSGVCQHNLAAATCLIDGKCIADGAYAGIAGNDSCRVCAGKFPSQYGWIILSNGESCNSGSASPVQYTCQTAGQCLAVPN